MNNIFAKSRMLFYLNIFRGNWLFHFYEIHSWTLVHQVLCILMQLWEACLMFFSFSQLLQLPPYNNRHESSSYKIITDQIFCFVPTRAHCSFLVSCSDFCWLALPDHFLTILISSSRRKLKMVVRKFRNDSNVGRHSQGNFFLAVWPLTHRTYCFAPVCVFYFAKILQK